MTVPYGWAAHVSDECCIVSPTNVHKMLCGRYVGFVPAVPPVHPHRVHEVCARLWAERGLSPVQVLDEYGRCPACWGDVPLAGGRVVAHRALVRTVSGPKFAGGQCPGEGELPEPEDEE